MCKILFLNCQSRHITWAQQHTSNLWNLLLVDLVLPGGETGGKSFVDILVVSETQSQTQETIKTGSKVLVLRSIWLF